MNNNKFNSYLKYSGPTVDEGEINISNLGQSLIGLDKLFNVYLESEGLTKKPYELKISGVKKNCTEININITPAIEVAGALYLFSKSMGLNEFGKGFFNTIGKQFALKIFGKGKSVDLEKLDNKEDGTFVAIIKNKFGEKKEIEYKEFEKREKYQNILGEMINLKKGEQEELEIGFFLGDKRVKVQNINYEESKYINKSINKTKLERMKEDFDFKNSKEIILRGKFMDYYAMAHKYKFAFQVRENQGRYGKKYILCKVDDDKVSKIIDLLKPEKKKDNVYVKGKVNYDNEGKIDKMVVIDVAYTKMSLSSDSSPIF